MAKYLVSRRFIHDEPESKIRRNKSYYDEIEKVKFMKHLELIQIDQSWRLEYDHYLKQSSHRQVTHEQSDNFFLNSQTQMSLSHTMVLSNMFNVAKAKKPIQNIYKRPI